MYIRPQLTQAVTWRIIAELFRRHHTNLRLHLIETYAGGGQYDCLSLYLSRKDFIDTLLCHFNLPTSHFHVFDAYQPPRLAESDLAWPDGNDYVQAYLTRDDPNDIVDGIEGVLGLPVVYQRSPITPAVLTLQIIAGLMDRLALSHDALWIRCGWYDSSGDEGSYIRRELQHTFGIKLYLSKRADWKEKVQAASRYWLLFSEKAGGERTLVALIDTKGFIYFADRQRSLMRTWEIYQTNGRDIEAIVNEVLRIVFLNL